MRNLPPLNALRSFEAAARKESFIKAAEALFVTPSAISHQIKSLEEFLGVELFTREKRSVRLTSAGEKYLNSIKHALNEIDIATRRLIATPNGNVINLSVGPAFLTRWLVPRINDLQKDYPDIELRLMAGNNLIDFKHSDIDMAIYYGEDDWKEAETQFLRKVYLAPVCSPNLLKGKNGIRKPEDLCNNTLIHVTNRRDEWKATLTALGVADPACGKDLTFSSTALAIGAATEGLGVALGDIDLIDRELKYSELVKPFDIQLDSGKAFYLAYQKGRKLPTAMQSFVQWMTKQLQLTDVTPI